MSYEGYIQTICERGHYSQRDDDYYAYQAPAWKCSHLFDGVVCGSESKESYSVDDTNCDSYGRREVILLTPETYETCNLGHRHIISAATYRFDPTPLFWDGERFLPISDQK